jgi:hypothetical protein
MKIVRTSAPPAPKSRSTKRFIQTPPNLPPVKHKLPQASNATAAKVQRDMGPGGSIDPRQQRF